MRLPAYVPQWLKSAAAAIFHVETRPLALRDTLPDQSPPPPVPLPVRDTLPDQAPPAAVRADGELAPVLRGQATQCTQTAPDSFRR
jgi:hypothetical protein